MPRSYVTLRPRPWRYPVIFDAEQELAYALSGTVPLPSPYPARGKLSAVLELQGTEITRLLFKIVHRVHLRLKITRLVDQSDLRAVRVPRDLVQQAGDGDDSYGGVEDGDDVVFPYRTIAPRVIEMVRARYYTQQRDQAASRQPTEPIEVELFDDAILYVDESASVLMDVGVGMTAAESANYYPPMTVYPESVRCDRGPRCDR